MRGAENEAVVPIGFIKRPQMANMIADEFFPFLPRLDLNFVTFLDGVATALNGIGCELEVGEEAHGGHFVEDDYDFVVWF